MIEAPTSSATPESRKRAALYFVRKAIEDHQDSERHRELAVWFARESGCSLREIGEAAGLPHSTIKLIADRAPRRRPETPMERLHRLALAEKRRQPEERRGGHPTKLSREEYVTQLRAWRALPGGSTRRQAIETAYWLYGFSVGHDFDGAWDDVEAELMNARLDQAS
jgi:hypothetical protein